MILSKEEHLKRLDLLERPMYDFEREDVQWGYEQLIKRVFDEDSQLTTEEIEVIEECAKHNNNYCSVIGKHCSMTYFDEKYCCEKMKTVIKKLEKQKEMLENVR